MDKLKTLIETLVELEKRVGFKVFLKYALLGTFMFAVINYKEITKTALEFFNSIEAEIHDEKLNLRDKLLKEMLPVLQDFRSDLRADRVLYFEYHNSKENLVSIPFKYIELVQQGVRYGTSPVNLEHFRNINTGAITNIYSKIKYGDIVYHESEDRIFKENYPGAYNLFKQHAPADSHVFISIPGINQPIGMIVLQWINLDEKIDVDLVERISNNQYIPRIGALILQNSKR